MSVLDLQVEKVVEQFSADLADSSYEESMVAISRVKERLEDIRAWKVWEHVKEHPEELVDFKESQKKVREQYGL